MRWVSDSAKRMTLGAVALFLLAGLLRLIPFHTASSLSGVPLACVTPTVYAGILMGWMLSLHWRISQGAVKGYLLILASLMILYTLLRTAKYDFSSPPEPMLRLPWYAYDLSMVLIPLMQLLAVLGISLQGEQRADPRWRMLSASAALLALGVVIHDLRELSSGFQQGLGSWAQACSRAPLYTAAALWITGLLLAALGIFLQKCRVSQSKKAACIPFAVLLVGRSICSGPWRTLSIPSRSSSRYPRCSALPSWPFGKAAPRRASSPPTSAIRISSPSPPWPPNSRTGTA